MVSEPPLVAATAEAISDEDGGVDLLFLADRAANPTWTIEFQRARTFDEQDEAQGMDTYCLVLPWGAVAYGGIETAELSDKGLRLRLSVAAAEALGTNRDLAIELHLDEAAAETVRSSLAVILGDVPTLLGRLTGGA